LLEQGERNFRKLSYIKTKIVKLFHDIYFGKAYLEQGELRYQQKQEDWERRKLEKLAKKYNYTLVTEMTKQ